MASPSTLTDLGFPRGYFHCAGGTAASLKDCDASEGAGARSCSPLVAAGESPALHRGARWEMGNLRISTQAAKWSRCRRSRTWISTPPAGARPYSSSPTLTLTQGSHDPSTMPADATTSSFDPSSRHSERLRKWRATAPHRTSSIQRPAWLRNLHTRHSIVPLYQRSMNGPRQCGALERERAIDPACAVDEVEAVARR